MKEKLAQLKNYLSELCAANNCVLWLSGGKDSLLLLQVLLTEKFSVLRFDDGWTREQKEIVNNLIKKHSLQVFSYPPKSAVLFGDGNGEITLACAYGVGAKGEAVSILRDLVHGSRCAFDVNIKISERANPPVIFDVNIWGSKKGEPHYAFSGGDVVPAKEWSAGNAKFVCPLYDWTDAEVLEALKLFGINYVEPPDQLNTGNVSACTNCLKGKTGEPVDCPKKGKQIYSIEWNPQEKLKNWQQMKAK